ncbi:hypothetical protein OB905_01050 [Halobacteria archaeon AArc-dxtr1]|nr:hypothetical protein [Halobacteria archaeon AArc-dxtr1]
MGEPTLGELFARDRRSEQPALEDPTGRVYDAHWLRTSAWKAGNFLRHTGVRRGVTVGVSGSSQLALLAFFGTALLGGTTRFEPPTELAAETDVRTVVAPTETIEEYELAPGGQRVGYGDAPSDPSIRHFEGGLWSENPSFPPVEVDPETGLLSDGDREFGRGRCLDAARTVVDESGLAAGDRVALRAPWSPAAVVAGVLAPLLADAVIVLPGSETESADVAVSGEASVPEPRRIDPASVEIA